MSTHTTTFNVNALMVSKSFWHTNNTIFDVELTYYGDDAGMVSFSKNNQLGNYWGPIDDQDKYADFVDAFKVKAKAHFDANYKW